MKQSRPYQDAIEREVPLRLKDHGATIVQAPTGAGKSHIINSLVKRIEAAGKVALVLSDNIKIHAQLVAECNGMKIDSGVKYLVILPGKCYVAMTQSLRNRDKIIKQFQELGDKLVVLVDECHRNTMTPLIQHIAPKFLIGFSATPHYRWAKHLPKLYKSLIHGPQISELVQDGYLSEYRHIIRTAAELDKLEKNSTGEFTEQSQDFAFSGPKMYDGVFEDLPVYGGKKICVYVASIKLCEKVAAEFEARGYRVAVYHSERDDKDYQLERFTSIGYCNVIVSVGALTLGWDCPQIDTIVLWRATTSLPLYLQMIGRGGRIFKGKHQFTCLDYGGNYERFGAWNMDRDWNELWQEPKKRRTTSTYAGVASVKDCPICQALVAISAKSCGECGYIWPVEEMRLIEGQLLEVQNTLECLKMGLWTQPLMQSK